uniref:Uncharacterized protein n=1 Tax=Arundo donax TaxID=35708 RepID=A0A0A9EFM7_ARUDO
MASILNFSNIVYPIKSTAACYNISFAKSTGLSCVFQYSTPHCRIIFNI